MRRPTSFAALERDVGRLRALAAQLAAAWGARARASTTVGQERALLRLLGVDGLDAEGRPLANEAVDRFVAGSESRLADGIALPFTCGLLDERLASWPSRLPPARSTWPTTPSISGTPIVARTWRPRCAASSASPWSASTRT